MHNNREQQGIEKKQALRKRRMAMGFATYLVPLILMLLFGGLGILPVSVILILTLIVVAVHGVYLYLFNRGFNLRFEDPGLTTVQIFIAVLLTLATMYFVEPGQARAAFMMVVAIPFLYGILGLNIKKFLKLCLVFVILYSGLILLLWKQKPHLLNPSLEIIQAVSFLLIITNSHCGRVYQPAPGKGTNPQRLAPDRRISHLGQNPVSQASGIEYSPDSDALSFFLKPDISHGRLSCDCAHVSAYFDIIIRNCKISKSPRQLPAKEKESNESPGSFAKP